ncbi:histidine kinase dimerization/phospho-acceptor domain-containing protein, partial [candidate division CSSED10-310 bacterium]
MDVSHFIKQFADTVPKLEFLVFFYDNPSTMDTVESLSIWSGIPQEVVQNIIEQWCSLGLMGREDSIYFLKASETLQPVIQEVVETYKTTRRIFRAELEKIVNEKDKETIQHKRALTAEIGKTDTILENITSGVLLTDAHNTIIKFNRAFRDLFPPIAGLSPPLHFKEAFSNPLVNKKLSSLTQKGEGTFFDTIADHHYEIQIAGVKDEQGNILKDEDDIPVGYLWIFRDISAQKELDKMKEDLSRMITHDLRSPMTGIFTAFDLILKNDADALPTHLYKSCQLGKRTSQFILGMVNDLIDIHKIEDDSIPIEKTPLVLNKIVEDSVEQIIPLIYDRNITLHRHLSAKPLTVLGDLQKLVRVIVNLLTNAVKFTP